MKYWCLRRTTGDWEQNDADFSRMFSHDVSLLLQDKYVGVIWCWEHAVIVIVGLSVFGDEIWWLLSSSDIQSFCKKKQPEIIFVWS